MHPTFFAGRSSRAEENLKHVTLYPEVSDYPAGGPSVHHFAAPGEVTLARLARRQGRYRMTLLRGEFVEVQRSKAFELGRTVTPEWSIAFCRLGCSPEGFLSVFPCDHIHGVYDDYREELARIGDVLGIEVLRLDR